MSRSYRRVPYIRQEKRDCHSLNRRIRAAKLMEIPKGAAYKKVFSDWNNWSYIWTREQAMQDYEERPGLKEKYTLEEWLDKWARWALRK